jgi:hypothetical protein
MDMSGDSVPVSTFSMANVTAQICFLGKGRGTQVVVPESPDVAFTRPSLGRLAVDA